LKKFRFAPLLQPSVAKFYSPTVKANLMSASFVSTYFGSEPLALTNRFLRNNPRSILRVMEFSIIPQFNKIRL
jgi:hypothetical protein